MGDSKADRGIFNQIKSEFVEKLVEKRFVDEEYAIYIYELSKNTENTKFKLNLEARSTTKRFKANHGHPLPIEIGNAIEITCEKYQEFAFGMEKPINSCKSIYCWDAGLRGIVENPEYWEGKCVYITSYQFESIRLVIFLVFDISPDSLKIEKKIQLINLNPVLEEVENSYHKIFIFDEKWFMLLKEKIDKNIFDAAYKSMDKLFYNYRYPGNLSKIYYDFLFHNLKMFYGKIKFEQQEKFLSLTREFENNQKNLFLIPYYRDHFFHQCNVYLLGLVILSIMCNKDFNRNIKDDFNIAYRLPEHEEYKDFPDVALIWFIASMFHDIAYPVEKIIQWLDPFVKQYICPAEYHKPILTTTVNISKIISDHSYSKCIENLAEYHRELKFTSNVIEYEDFNTSPDIKKACKIRNRIISRTIDSLDHGILSALMLLNRFQADNEISKYLFPAVSAISVHNSQWIDEDTFKEPCKSCKDDHQCGKCRGWKETYDKYFENDEKPLRYIKFEKNPVEFLLILCDTLQDWGRHNYEQLSQVNEFLQNQSNLTDIKIADKKIIFDFKTDFEAGMDFVQRKKQEIAKVFSRLKFIEDHDIVVNLYPPGKDEPIVFSMNSFQ